MTAVGWDPDGWEGEHCTGNCCRPDPQPPGRPGLLTRFRLHLRHRVFDGWIEPDGHTAVAIEDPAYGLTASADSLDDLLRGYGGGHTTWHGQHHAPPAQHEGEPSDRDPDR